MRGTFHILRRCGLFFPRTNRSIWIQGETPEQFDSAMRFLHELKDLVPHFRMVFTSSNPGTMEWLRARFVDDTVAPAPLDLELLVRRFYKSLSPSLVILLDSAEGFGPRALNHAGAAGVPVIAVNVQEKNGGILKHLLSALVSSHSTSYACVPDSQTAELLKGKGVPAQKMAITGDLAFEYAFPSQNVDRARLRKTLGLAEKEPVIIAEKITPEEESMVTDLFFQLRRSYPDVVLLLEPRYRAQIRRIISAFAKRDQPVELRSQGAVEGKSKVILFDVPGELQAFYRIATCVLAGGSFSKEGNQIHVVGPARAGTPVLLGPHLGSEAKISRLFIDEHAVIQIQSPAAAEEICRLIESPELSEQVSVHAKEIIQNYAGASEKTTAVIKQWIPNVPYEPPVAERWRVPTWRDHGGQSKFWKNAAAIFMKRRIDDWDALKSRLHHPQSILCLGNGPSSEDPRVHAIEHDCLLRVNWKWKLRGILADPDLVFVGDPRTLQELSDRIFAFWNIRLEYGMLLRYFVTHGPRRMDYITLERMSPLIQEPHWLARPSNGALMVVAAAALQPARMVIAGIDLFLHPDGRYPGDLRSNNQYAQPHHRMVDLAIIHRALQDYHGELIVLSDILRDSLAAFQDDPDLYVTQHSGF